MVRVQNLQNPNGIRFLGSRRGGGMRQCFLSIIALCAIRLATPMASCEEEKTASEAKSDPFVAYVASNRAQLAEFIVEAYNRGYLRRGNASDNTNEITRLEVWGMGLGAGLERDRLVHRVIDVAEYSTPPGGGWITNRLAISFLVAALRSKERDLGLAVSAENALVNVFPPALAEHEAEMIKLDDRAPLRILARINRNPSTDVKSLVEEASRSWTDMPREILARIGDRAAEQALVDEFTRETDARAKGELALKLGYVASSNALIAIATEFRSPLVVYPEQRIHWIGGEYLLRYKILLGLREAFPEVPLFSEELSEVVKQTEGCFLGGLSSERTKRCAAISNSYYDKVEEWLTAQFGVRWERPRPEDFVLKRAGFRFTPLER